MQSKGDTSNYDIRLQIIPIWTKRADGYWFYVEHVMAKMIDKPYRQRVYHVTTHGANEFESAIFTLKAPLRFAGNSTEVE